MPIFINDLPNEEFEIVVDNQPIGIYKNSTHKIHFYVSVSLDLDQIEKIITEIKNR